MRDGLIGEFIFGGSEKGSTYNGAPNTYDFATKVGEPTLGAGYGVFEGETGYYTSNITDPGEITIVAVAAPPDDFVPASRFGIVGNFPAAVSAKNTSMYCGTGTTIAFQAGQDLTIGNIELDRSLFTDWTTFIGRAGVGQDFQCDFEMRKGGVSLDSAAMDTTGSTRIYDTSSPFLLGALSDYAGFLGEIKLACVLIWSRVLSDVEVNEVVSDLQEFAASRGISA
ncbi:hypothetical protein Q4560_14020 [Celeribacter halophilus]|uniref:Peptidase A1 domain-containing protein n=1 Tax=Celeribacter halophilus TaxID=576117 RepID=A0AAW7XVU6_9RHOB|nr:hypothetical protein [Celeribacter halophilus]MDO6457429.1 hypothetical protein [Celeribacter halophilus]MDO6724392.1 hypothetical protein [Celeribacter halophilus]